MGFSAGGHLAAVYGTQQLGFRKYGIEPPSALLLSYPAVSMHLLTHKKMKELLMGKNSSEELVDSYSIEKNVDPQYPPTFIWQSEGDRVVIVEHSKLLINSLNSSDVQSKLQTYSGGKHGLGLGIGTNAEGWLVKAIEFWKTHPRSSN